MTTNRKMLLAVLMTTAGGISVSTAFANEFRTGNVFVGTIEESADDNQIFKVLPDGTSSIFADSISGGITALEFDPARSFLYALVTRGGGSPIRQVLRFSPDGTSELFSDLSQIPAAQGAGDTDIEFDVNGNLFLTTSTLRVVELHGGANGTLRFEGPTGSVYHALELSNTGDVFLGNRGGDVIHLDPNFSNPSTLGHVPLSHPEIDFQAIDSERDGDLIAMVQDASSGANIYRVDETGTVTPLAQTANQAGKLAIGQHDNIHAVSLNRIEVYDRDGTLIDTVQFARQLDGIATAVPEPASASLFLAGLVFAVLRRARRA